MKMGRTLRLVLALLSAPIVLIAADWNIFNQKGKQPPEHEVDFDLKNYCESWRMNVELHNIREFQVVPEECTDYIRKYMDSVQYKVDSERAIEEATVFLSTSCDLDEEDGGDAWIFDVDDTLLSTMPYFKKHQFGGEKLNLTSLEEWMSNANAPALDHTMKLFNKLKETGVEIILISSRREYLRSATVTNLVSVGFYEWTSLILRDPSNEWKSIKKYKADIRQQFIDQGYRIWGIVGDQWSSFDGLPSAKRTFKLPNPMYYVT